MSREVLMLIDGADRRAAATFDVHDYYRDTVSSVVHSASPADVDAAVQSARHGFAEISRLPANKRAAIIRKVAESLPVLRDQFAEQIVRDCGKCLRDARGEVDRAYEILSLSAEEATRIGGELIPLDALPLGEGIRLGFAIRMPVGVVAAIGPFNAPLHVLAHKLGPAFAAGNAVVVKPAPQGSAVTALLAQLFYGAGLPKRALQMVPGDAAAGAALVAHPGVDFINFTGGGRAADAIIRTAGLKKVSMELGGNAAVIIHSDADWEKAAAACVGASYGIAGQSCVSLQRLYVHRSLHDRVAERMVSLTRALRLGDTLSAETEIGAMINPEAAARVESWLQEAVADGARVLCGGKRLGPVSFEPTVMADVTPQMKLVCEEVFGPVVSLIAYDDVEAAIDAVNDSPWGLAGGIFTNDLNLTLQAIRRLRTGVLNVNGPSRFRVEHMPYGGVKLSGWGKEGPRYAIQEMTEIKMVTISAM